MTTGTLVFFLEEPSAQAMLDGILPRILSPHITPRYVVFEGKQDLEKRVEKRARGWLSPRTAFIVLRDKDGGDCYRAKETLRKKLEAAGRSDALVRIACHELESFYLGDLKAVEKGLGCNQLARLQQKQKYRNPDAVPNPSFELTRITDYQKISGSRAIGPHLKIDGTNRSISFNVLISGIRRVANEL